MVLALRQDANYRASDVGITPFSESAAWASVGDGWRHLHGCFRNLGFSFEWHDFVATPAFDWAESFHPDGVEICLNLAGSGTVGDGRRKLELTPFTAGFYAQGERRLLADRRVGERHQFIITTLSSPTTPLRRSSSL